MEDVAKRVNISKGAIYLCVESKEALFELALRKADRREPFEVPDELPLPTPSPEYVVDFIRTRLAEEMTFPSFPVEVANLANSLIRLDSMTV